jgi:hypothetical protein
MREQGLARPILVAECSGSSKSPRKKGRLQSKRPKSREETPKEGGGNEQNSLPRCNNIAPRRTKGKGVCQDH